MGTYILCFILLLNLSSFKGIQATLSVELLAWNLAEFVKCNADYYVNIIPVSSNSSVHGKRYHLT